MEGRSGRTKVRMRIRWKEIMKMRWGDMTWTEQWVSIRTEKLKEGWVVASEGTWNCDNDMMIKWSRKNIRQ